MSLQYIQYGCGWESKCAPKSWRNFDASPTLRFERIPLIGQLHTRNKYRYPNNVEYGDIVYGLPVANGSCKAVYCSHVLEHLSLYDLRMALRNTHKILEPGGIFRFVLPDLEFYIKEYINNPSIDGAIDFIRNTRLGKENRIHNLMKFISEWLGNSQHLWMWDFKSLRFELEQASYIEVRRAQFHDSTEQMFKEIEFRERWENCLGMECRKPKQ
jgi:predicted SAM-dependent methyltransferase